MKHHSCVHLCKKVQIYSIILRTFRKDTVNVTVSAFIILSIYHQPWLEFIVPFLFFIELGESIYDPPQIRLISQNFNKINQ